MGWRGKGCDMQISLLSQSLGLWFGQRRSSRHGGAAGSHARVMHTLLGTGGGQGLLEGVGCLVALLAPEYITVGDGAAGFVDIADTVWLWGNGSMDLR